MVRLALVEDHLMFREALKVNLDAIPDFKVVAEAECGKEFERLYSPTKMDIILMDLRLRGQHGFITCRNLLRKYPGIKIIILSMHDDPSTVISLIRCGAVGFMSKNDSLDQIEKTIREVMRYGYYYNQDIGGMMRHEVARLFKKIKYDDDLNVCFSEIEMQIAIHYCNQMSTVEIAAKLDISPRTVENHKRAMVDRTLCSNFVGVILYMFRNQLLYAADFGNTKNSLGDEQNPDPMFYSG